MRNKQLVLLFLTNLIMFFTGMGLFPLLPVFSARFGVSPTVIGMFLASLSAMNAAGALLASRLLRRFTPRTLFIVFGAVGVPGMLILTQAGAFWVVVVAAGLVWFSGGVVAALMSVLIGLAVEPAARGRAFSQIFLASPIAAVAGGTTLGALIGSLGYTSAFILLGGLWALIPVLGFLLEGDRHTAEMPATSAPTRPVALGSSFTLLLASVLAIITAIQMSNVAALLQMQAAGFSASAISSTTVVSGLVTIPAVFLAGSLSDRIGRRALLLLAYLLAIVTVAPLAGAGELWHFSSGIALLMVAATVVRPGASALATDILDPTAVQRGLPLLDAGIMGVGVIGSAGAGYVLETFGALALSLLAASLGLVGGAILLVVCLQCTAGQPRLVLALRFLHRS